MRGQKTLIQRMQFALSDLEEYTNNKGGICFHCLCNIQFSFYSLPLYFCLDSPTLSGFSGSAQRAPDCLIQKKKCFCSYLVGVYSPSTLVVCPSNDYIDTFSLFLCFRYPSQHVFCSEQSSSGPSQSARDKNPDGHKQEQDSRQHEVCAKQL